MATDAKAALLPGASETLGLSGEEAARRLRRDGPNALPQPDRRRWPRLALDVLREPMLLLLIAATSLYLFLGEAGDAVVLAVSVALVVALTLYQELRSERALQALRDLSTPSAWVARDGAFRRIPAADLVVGDVVRIAEGDRVPADGRLLSSEDLQVDESLLTGESAPVAKRTDGDPESASVRAGTLAVRGQAQAEVTATGIRTEMGRIGASLGEAEQEPTQLQLEIRRLVVWFAAISAVSCLLLGTLHALLRGDWLQAVLAGITLAMANIPEEFPVVLAVFLALGAWRMARYRVLVRRPPAIEALGAVTVLCTDKTGTLTENRMSLVRIVADGAAPGEPAAAPDAASLALLHCAVLASDEAGYDPMDRAIRDTGERWLPFSPPPTADACLRRYPVSPALPIYACAWRATATHDALVACKGAPEAVAALCGLAPEKRAQVLAKAASMAAEGLRVLAVAQAALEPGCESGQLPHDLHSFRFEWLGWLGFADPLRDEVPAAVAEARSAGVRVIMLTGDHLETARAIAMDAGIGERERPHVALGRELERLDAEGLSQVLAKADVFARVRPEHKLRLVEALKAQGEVVAMTGDGVNDAPALAAAHVGVAMGGRGTDVAREAAEIVVLDDDFVSVVRALRMGRTIYANLRRAARYIIAVHVPITGLALLPLLLGTPLILLPLHVVFLEMIIDPASSIVLEREPAEPDLMRRPPRSPAARLVDLRSFAASVARGMVTLAAVVAVFAGAMLSSLDPRQSAALAFAALVTGNLGLVASYRARTAPGLRRPPNRAFGFIAFAAGSLLAAITLLEAPARWFGFAPVPPAALACALLLPLAALGTLRLIGLRGRAGAAAS